MARMTNASDTLATARRLETDFGMDRRAAEGVATAINERFTENVATKADVELLKADIEKLATSTKADVQRLETQVVHLDEKLTGRIDGLDEKFTGRINGLDKRIDGLDMRVDELDKSVAAQTEALKTLKYSVSFGLAVAVFVLAALQVYGLVR